MNKDDAILNLKYAIKWIEQQPSRAGKVRVLINLEEILAYFEEGRE